MNRALEANARAERRRLRRQFGAEFDACVAAFRQHDPAGVLGPGAPSDEYYPEVEAVLARLDQFQTLDDVRTVLHEELVRWFGKDVLKARRLAELASALWRVVREREVVER